MGFCGLTACQDTARPEATEPNAQPMSACPDQKSRYAATMGWYAAAQNAVRQACIKRAAGALELVRWDVGHPI